ncbi:MAG: EamA family transporter [Ruminococcus sp.]|nr:EamA family transporter [Ruminococcus sp.]
MKDKKEQLGMLYVILSGILFGTMPLLAKIAYAHGSNAYSVAFVRFLSGTILLFIITMLLPGCKVKIGKEEAKEIIKLSFFYALAPILLYLTYNYMDSGMATTLHFTYPVTVILLRAVFLKKGVDFNQTFCTILCVGGIALLYTPNGRVSIQGILIAVVSGIIYAVYIVLLGDSKVKAMHPLVLSSWVALFSTIEIGIIAVCTGNLVLEVGVAGWISEIAMGVLGTVLALALFQKGLFLCGDVKASLLSSFEPLTGIVIGMIAFQERLNAKEMAGVSAIILATILLVAPALLAKESKRAQKNK